MGYDTGGPHGEEEEGRKQSEQIRMYALDRITTYTGRRAPRKDAAKESFVSCP